MLLKGALSAPFCLVQRSRRVNVQVTVAFLVCIYEQAGANVDTLLRVNVAVDVGMTNGSKRWTY